MLPLMLLCFCLTRSQKWREAYDQKWRALLALAQPLFTARERGNLDVVIRDHQTKRTVQKQSLLFVIADHLFLFLSVVGSGSIRNHTTTPQHTTNPNQATVVAIPQSKWGPTTTAKARAAATASLGKR